MKKLTHLCESCVYISNIIIPFRLAPRKGVIFILKKEV
nr:MAG TPA: hypothetical protein [Caudoviricetes sp.]